MEADGWRIASQAKDGPAFTKKSLLAGGLVGAAVSSRRWRPTDVTWEPAPNPGPEHDPGVTVPAPDGEAVETVSRRDARRAAKAEAAAAKQADRAAAATARAERVEAGEWWATIAPTTVAVNAQYLNVRTPTKSMGMGTLKLTESGIQWRGNLGTPKIVMPYPTIQAVDINGETTSRLTVTRVATLGVFALGARKSKRVTHLTIVTDTGDYGFLIETAAPEAVSTKLRPVLAALRAQTPPDAATDTAPPAGAAPVSVAGELDKLASLRDRGLLTDDEFAAQKAKLLGG